MRITIKHILPPVLGALLTTFMSIVAHLRPWPATLPRALLALDNLDLNPTPEFSSDFGRLLSPAPPAAVLRPTTPADIASLVRLSCCSSPRPFPIAARGCGHAVHGQALAPGGVTVEMAALGRDGSGSRINVSAAPPHRYVDAGGEQLWIDVLAETLKHGLAPQSWTDYLHLTVGGTLSNAGVSGQAFRHGPQISNVYELDVITGEGEMLTCSAEANSDLFYAVLGGLGQFGIITRARIAVEAAPRRVRWVRLVYADFAAFTRDQELLISMTEDGFDYVEGSLLSDHTLVGNWRSSFFIGEDREKIKDLAAEFGNVYCLEGAMYYDYYINEGERHIQTSSVDKRVAALLKQLSFVRGFAFTNDVSFVGFLDRVHDGEMKLRGVGLWDVPHPWLNIFVPKSRIHDFEAGVFKGILRHNNSMGPVLIYPLNKNMWDERMSAVTPNEEVFYSIGLLRSAVAGEWEHLERQNDEILSFCSHEGIELKQYLPHYTTQVHWMKHFGAKWDVFVDRKRRYDPKALLSPGQQIFKTQSLVHDDVSSHAAWCNNRRF